MILVVINMKISKTMFKEYSKCNNFYNLEQIYYKKKNSNVDDWDVYAILEKMFDEEGEDLVKISDEKLQAMQDFYKDVERVALKEACNTFNRAFVYKENTKEQMKLSFIDKNGYEFYTYLDGFYDSEDIYVIEVKATTSSKYLKLGPTINGKLESIFECNDNIIKLKNDIYNDNKKMKHYMKLFDRSSDVGKYIYDIAVTYFIYKGFVINNFRMSNKPTKFYLALLNSNYIYDGKSDYERNSESIVHFLDVTTICEEYQNIIKKDYDDIIQNIIRKDLEKKYSKSCDGCIYEKICFPFTMDKNNIKTLLAPKTLKINGEKKNLISLINSGYKYIKDLKVSDLEKKKHLIQYNCIVKEEEYINVDSVTSEINGNIKYPIYHLDFESFQSPLPRFKFEKPYMQSVFQFSVHIQRKPGECDKDADNYSYIPFDFLDHREDLIKEMIKIIDLSKGGTVLVYNKNFEYSRISEMVKMFPKYEKELKMILDHMYDLMDVVKKGEEGVGYYHPLLNGSYSIKKLLPIYSDISYSDLEVKNGCEAQIAYLMFKYLPLDEIKQIRNDLITYCKQDTYSMVEILDGIRKKVRYK